MSQSERKDLLAQLMGLNIFDKLYVEASDEIKDMNTLIRKFKRDDFTQELSDLEVEKEELKSELSEITQSLSDYNFEMDECDVEIDKLYGKLIPLGSIDTDIDNIEQNIEKVSKTIDKYPNRIEEFKNKLDEQIKRRDELQQELEGAEGVKQRYESHLEHKDEYQKAVKEFEKKHSEVKHTRKALDKIKESLELEINDECNACIANAKKFNKDYEDTVRRLDELIIAESAVNNLKNELEKLVDDSVEKEWYELKQLHSQFKSTIQSIKYSESQIQSFEDMIEAGEKQIEMLEGKAKLYYDSEDAINSNEVINQQIQEKKNEKRTIKSNIDAIEREKEKKNKRLGSVENRIDTILGQIEEAKELEQKLRVYEYYLDSVKRDGIPYDLIKKVIPVIEDEVNNILQQIVDFSVNIDVDGKNINAKIVYDDKEWPLELASGMERFIAGLAIRVSLMNISNLPRPNFIVIDEGFGVLDADNLNSIFMLFQYLKSQFKFVVVISHLDSMRDVVNDFIEIKKEKGFSKIQHL
jgi:exonuclease SbcC